MGSKQRVIYAINPSKRKKKKAKAKKKGVSTMARKKRKPAKRKRVYRRNPAKRRKVRRTAKSVARRGFSGLSFKKALGNMVPAQVGMFAAKWACKRFGDNDATETNPSSWGWDSYLKGAVGGIGAGFLANMVKPGSGQKVLEGALNYITFKAVQNELVAKSSWAVEQFGADDYTPDEYLMTGEDESWFLGEDGNAYPTDEMYRLPEAGYGNALVDVGPLGESLVPVDQLGSVSERYRSAYNQQM